ncbi:hypothetical protein BC628DRAFT_1383158 [Trametes gibbosa]|nr:hypothetical protein BC628DRAFT_1383158 [Trametes gibbosa]
MSVFAVPSTLWHVYLDNLVFYEDGSWVDSVASTCRFLAFAVLLPFILLTLFDVASYVIARTLGVIDATKASTSGGLDTADALPGTKPSIIIHSESESSTPPHPTSHKDAFDRSRLPHTTPPASYFRNPTEEEGNLQLAGVGTFSPAPSQPGSPTLQRREFLQHAAHFGEHLTADSGTYEDHDHDDGEDGASAGSGAATPRDVSGLRTSSAGSSSGDSSFAILDRDSGSEDAGVVLRRRTRRSGTPDSTGPETEDGAA